MDFERLSHITKIFLFSIEVFFSLLFTSLQIYNLRPLFLPPILQFYFYFLYSEAEPETKYEKVPEVEARSISNVDGEASFGRWGQFAVSCQSSRCSHNVAPICFQFLTSRKICDFFLYNKPRALTIFKKCPCLLYMLSFLLCFAHNQK